MTDRTRRLEDTGIQLVGVVLSAPDMYYVEEDAGLGVPPTIWDFSGITSRSVGLYFDAQTGKLVAVLDMGDSVGRDRRCEPGGTRVLSSCHS